MKHWIVLGLAALSLGILAGCNGGASSSTSTTGSASGSTTSEKKLKVGIVFDTGGRGDASFNDSAWRGIEKAQKDLGAEAVPIESRSEKDYANNLRTMADQGCNLVVAVGINMETALNQVAPEYPDTKFAIVDAPSKAENVRSLLFAEHEGSFLVGYLAGLMTKTNKIGFVGGQELDLIKKFEVGYAAGAKMANANVVLLPAKYTGSWDNVDQAKVAANALFAGGADIVYHAAGRAGKGVIDAAREKKLWAIGVDSDQDHLAEGFVLTSMIKKVDESVYQTIKDLQDGKFTSGAQVYDLKSGGVGVSELRFTKDKIGQTNLDKLADVEGKIKSGEIKVPQTPAELAAFKP